MKKCTKCKEFKDESAFNKDRTRKDGLQATCTECRINAQRESASALKNYRKYRATAKWKAVMKRAFAKRLKTRPERVRAAQKLSNAVKNGKVIKQPCFVCGEEKTEGHHPCYSLPLDVVWLCKSHHQQLHREARKFIS